MALCRQVIQAHVDSVVLIRCRKRARGSESELGAYGTGFIVHMDPRFCLVMTCGHVLEDYVKDTISVSFGHIEMKARVVFAEYVKEVSMLRVDRNTNPQSYDTIAGYPAVHWSTQEAQEKHLVAILSRVKDPESHLSQLPSIYHGNVS